MSGPSLRAEVHDEAHDEAHLAVRDGVRDEMQKRSSCVGAGRSRPGHRHPGSPPRTANATPPFRACAPAPLHAPGGARRTTVPSPPPIAGAPAAGRSAAPGRTARMSTTGSGT
ncbi:hypothetical protein ACFV28_09610 [Streptomyces sp. NPDC059720]|uniref:hypothetical protein n=1 Tax=Streptomyces sp. NPDC059720 TaxID=3346924 RepID=UPI0036984811